MPVPFFMDERSQFMRKFDIINGTLRSALAALALTSSAVAVAAPGDSETLTGEANASVVEPIGIQNVADLRFGRIIQPTTAGTLTIAPNGASTQGGGVVGNSNTPQVTNGRGRAAFAVFGDPNRYFAVFGLPATATVSNGSATMTVDQFQFGTTAPTLFGIFPRLDATGYAPLFIGARLNVAANQDVGSYSGTYPVSVFYF